MVILLIVLWWNVTYFSSSPFHTWCNVSAVRYPSHWHVSGAWLRSVCQRTHRPSAAKKAAFTTFSPSPLAHNVHAFLLRNRPRYANISLVERTGYYRGTLKACWTMSLFYQIRTVLIVCSFFSPLCPTHRTRIQDETSIPLIWLSKIPLNQSHGWGTGEAIGKVNKRVQPVVLYSPASISFHIECLKLQLFVTLLSVRQCGTKEAYACVSALSLG